MTDELTHLLGMASGGDRPETDAMADLDRGKKAARARFRRRYRAGTAGLVLTAIAGFGVSYALNDPASHRTDAGPAAVRLVDATFGSTPYTFDLTPRGWSVQSQNADHVTIAPDDGSASGGGNVFVGKLVILFDQNPVDGEQVVDHGRTFWIGGDSGYTAIATRTRRGEPVGVVRVQYPSNTGWTRATMLAFLGSVHVGPGALPGLG